MVTKGEEERRVSNVVKMERHGSLVRLLRVTSYVIRFVKNLKNKREGICLFFNTTNKNNTKLTTYKYSVSAVAGEDMVSSSPTTTALTLILEYKYR